MPSHPAKNSQPKIALPDIHALSVNLKEAVLLTPEGEIKTLPHNQAKLELGRSPVLVCHAPYTRQRLGAENLIAFDLLELFAFVHPARFCVPTPYGLAKALGLSIPTAIEDYPFTLMEAATALLSDFQKESLEGKKANPLEIAAVMGLNGKGWAWTPYIFSAIGETYDPAAQIMAKPALNIWKNLPEWAEDAPPPPPSHHTVTGEESRQRLEQLLSTGDKPSEPRQQQTDYTTRITTAFAPAEDREHPHVVLAEAGTGTGKTLGYLAPASVWAEKNDSAVWISTYTKNLQRQIDQELSRLHPHPGVKDSKVAVRKGRENYLCLLNMEDTVAGAALAKHPNQAIAAGIMARWAERTRDGDMSGGDFPGWLPGILGYHHTRGLSDTRGECIYSACDHYHRCFVERSVRKAKRADIVVANHALVMIQTALSGPEENLPQRYVFDEGHHLFDAADSAFAGHLTARESHDLRRWIRGSEGGKQSRARGLKRRVEDLITGDQEAEANLEAIIYEAGGLPAHGWSRRLKDQKPQGATESFLLGVYRQVYARAEGTNGPYSLETQTHPLLEGLDSLADELRKKLRELQKPMRSLSKHLRDKLSEHADTLDSDTRKRLESVAASLDRRCEHNVAAWIAMLETLKEQKPSTTYVDWMEIERIDGKAIDIGLYRHWVDPMQPFAASIKNHAHGIAITSATLCDATDNEEENWRAAKEQTGSDYLSTEASMFTEDSPFDYESCARAFIISDVNKNDMQQVASAYRILFEASQGGAVGLFTAIQRLRAVRNLIAAPLEEKGIPLYAQHADEIDTGTLVDMFREDTHACLLGTDAVRDGVDVPGESLRMLVYDRVPWPRPTILHTARRKAFGNQRYNELVTRLKLRQAFGRLIRKHDDKGVFVMLDSGLPTRMLGAFPKGTVIHRIGLAEASAEIQSFLHS